MTAPQGTASGPDAGPGDDVALDQAQIAFFHTFGFLHLPGRFADEITRISRGFDEVFARGEDVLELDPSNSYHHTDDPDQTVVRAIVPGFLERSEDLAWIRHDPRVTAIVDALIGPGAVYGESDGNLFNCDVRWHIDNYNAPVEQFHIKLFFYLDRLRAESGAIRFIPGSQSLDSAYARTLRRELMQPDAIESTFGVAIDEIPSYAVEVEPGDLVVGSFRTLHASFGGGAGRRLFTVNFSEPTGAEASRPRADLPASASSG